MKRKRSKYDPDRAQDEASWSARTEGERITLVQDHHRRAGVRLPNAKLHALTHVTVENQILLGDETPVAATLERLMREGLSRHDAIHAIGTVLAPVILGVVQGEVVSDPNIPYFQGLGELTAKSWLSEYS